MQVPTRKLPARNAPGLRGKRKRALDFFNSESLAATDQVLPCGGVSPSFVEAKVQGSEQGESKGSAGTDVLEKAYHAAMALAAVQTSHTDGSPTSRPKYASDDDVPPESFDSHLDEERSLIRAPRESTENSSHSEAVSTKRSEKHTVPDEGSRTVEAEGLIWVDNSQATAYSVRYVLHELVHDLVKRQ